MHPIVNIAVKAARNASKIILHSMDQLDSNSLNIKQRNNLIQEIESVATEEIVNTIHAAHPEHHIFDKEQNKLDQEPIWIIDAIDGITNYAHSIPHFAISIAVKEKSKIQHALIYDPICQELFTATRGEGASLNDRRIRVSQQKNLEDALLGTGFPRHQTQHLEPFINTFSALFPQSGGIRRGGSAALDLAYVAAGRLDGFWEFSLKLWNMTAGSLLVTEAGGLVSDFQGEERFLETGNLVAGNPKIFKAILQTIQPSLRAP